MRAASARQSVCCDPYEREAESGKATLTKKLAKPQQANGKETISVSAELRPYLEIVEEEGVKKVVVKEQKWQEALESKDFYAIASSEDMTADEIDTTLQRNSS